MGGRYVLVSEYQSLKAQLIFPENRRTTSTAASKRGTGREPSELFEGHRQEFMTNPTTAVVEYISPFASAKGACRAAEQPE